MAAALDAMVTGAEAAACAHVARALTGMAVYSREAAAHAAQRYTSAMAAVAAPQLVACAGNMLQPPLPAGPAAGVPGQEGMAQPPLPPPLQPPLPPEPTTYTSGGEAAAAAAGASAMAHDGMPHGVMVHGVEDMQHTPVGEGSMPPPQQLHG